jgi:exodeoxyribonuclease-3
MSSSLKIASWNVNSVRARIGIVEQFLDQEQPDILCLQETKVVDADFPKALFEQRGYRDIVLCGQRMHHGVAVLSRLPLVEEQRNDWQANGEARHIGVRLPNGIRLENVYIPAGGDVPDREQNPKFGQKLDFIERMTRWSETCRCPTIVVGDFNVAPLECDVWSHKQLLNVVSHTPIEVEALMQLQASNDWVDLGRYFHPAPKRLHTWWSYRSPDWSKNDRGPPARPHVGDQGCRRAREGASRPRALPELDAAFGSRPARDGVRHLSSGRDVARAVDALRRGWPGDDRRHHLPRDRNR